MQRPKRIIAVGLRATPASPIGDTAGYGLSIMSPRLQPNDTGSTHTHLSTTTAV